MKNYKKIINEVKKIAKEKLKNESTGHDYWHVYRVAHLAVFIAKEEKANIVVVELAAWLHDISAGHDKDHEIRGAKFAEEFLIKFNLDKKLISWIVNCIKHHRFSKGIKPKTIEEKIVQDADKLEALGAIGLARLFILAGHYGQLIHDPKLKPDFNYYLKHGISNTTINHFYDKIFKLKNLMHTKTAKKIAENREKYMRHYLERFYAEWEGKS